MVRGDRFLFEQMVTQVLDNAWKYAGPGARIWISAYQAGDEVVLTIRNEGNQIPEEERGLVFERFYRGTRSRAGIERHGAGVGYCKDHCGSAGWKSLAGSCGGRAGVPLFASGRTGRGAGI